jgi:ubiquinone/menaquinone biosynthesis C-methylase UbiE
LWRVETESARRDSYLPALRFKRLTPLFDGLVLATMRESAFKRALVEQARLEPGLRVVDLGCGTGTLALLIKDREPGCSVVGVDADPEILRRASAKAEEAGAEIEFDEALSTDLPYEDESVDRVLSTLFFHHLMPDDKHATLAEIRRVLRPGGQIHVADFGAPADPIQRALSYQVRLFDGLERTRENFAGDLPGLVADAGLRPVTEHQRLRTGLGTLSLFSAEAIA